MYVLRKHNPPQSATDYIALAIEQVMKLVPDTGQLPTRADIEQLCSICTALEYATAIAAEIKRELESKLEMQANAPMH